MPVSNTECLPFVTVLKRGMAVRIQKEMRGHKAEAEWLLRRARRHIRSLSLCRVPAAAVLRKAELSLSLVTDKSIRVLNRQWRKKDKATDVLSFPLLEVAELRRASGAVELGDIVISLDAAKRQAAEQGHSLLDELDLLLVHGLLHLLGFDHELSPAEAARMRKLEKKILGRSMIG
jgi:rRNA maturation RNase YbeY